MLYPQRVTGKTGCQKNSSVPTSGNMNVAESNHMANQRIFLAAIVAASTLLLPWRRLAAAKTDCCHAIPLCRRFIAGFQLHQGPALLSILALGQQLTLKRAPENPYDELTIDVHMACSSKIGYLQGRLNEIPTNIMDSGKFLNAFITDVSQTAPPWEMVAVEIQLGRNGNN